MAKQTKLGKILFLGMGLMNGHKMVISIGYTLPYAMKKAQQAVIASKNQVAILHYSVIKTGEKKAEFKMSSNGMYVLENEKTDKYQMKDYDGSY